MKTTETRREALKLVDKIMAMKPDAAVMAAMQQVRGMIKLPMSEVLIKVPGSTVVDKARVVGVSRQAWYAWKRGESRPNPQQADRLAELTGIAAHLIRGLPAPPSA
jgi:hypothetical protein